MRVSPGRADEPVSPPWRTIEVRTRLQIASATGATRAWIPLPLAHDTGYQRTLGNTWNGNASKLEERHDKSYVVSMLYAEWLPTEPAPALDVVSRVATRDRIVDVGGSGERVPPEEAGTLELYLKPTRLIPTDGIVLETSRTITEGRTRTLDKARAIYEWIVENTFRDPKVAGCGTGNIKAMLETRYLGGKCADLNGLFVGLARSSGIPARDVYGIRAGDSKDFKCLGRSGDITKAQHCRAEFYVDGMGWIPVDPADVRKVALEEPPGGLPLDSPSVRHARDKLFGAWEMNWVAYNYGHDVELPGSEGAAIPYLLYPQCETGGARKNALEPASFAYEISFSEST